MCLKLVTRRRVVLKIVAQEFLDLRGNDFGLIGPPKVKMPADVGNHPAPVGNKALVVDKNSQRPTGRIFGFEQVAQPDQTGKAGAYAVARGKRRSDRQWIAQRDNVVRLDPALAQNFGVERQEPADARVLENEESRCAVFFLDQFGDFALDFVSPDNRDSVQVQSAPVIPAAA